MTIQLAITMILAGSVLLAWSADRFVTGASVAARNWGVSPLIIGVTILGFATSLPEMLVAMIAARQGNPIIGIGSAIGSNIVNIGVVLGVSALFVPISVRSQVLRREFPILLTVVFFTAIILSNRFLSFNEGVLLLFGFVLLVVWLIKSALRVDHVKDPIEKEISSEIPKMKTYAAVLWIVFGFLVLMLSSQMLVNGAEFVARTLGISDLVIGLTIVAIGTSLPELATSVMSVIKNEHDIAVGNILGSCMFNLLAVLAMPALIHPTHVPVMLLWRDFPVMCLFIFALFGLAYGFRGRLGQITRVEGALLIFGYLVYLGILGFGRYSDSIIATAR